MASRVLHLAVFVIYLGINPITSKGNLRKILNKKGYTVVNQESVEVTLYYLS